MALTVLAGSDFCISDDRGDVREGALGFFARDTRHLARFVLTLDNAAPQLLSCRHDVPHRATFFLRNALSDGLRHDDLLVVRERRVAVGLLEDIAIRNLASEPKRFSVGLELEVDFADIFSVKERDMQFGDPLHARPLPAPVTARPSDDGTVLVFGDADDAELRTHVFLSRPSEPDGTRLSWSVELAPREEWRLTIDVVPGTELVVAGQAEARSELDLRVARVEDSQRAWQAAVPRLTSSWRNLALSYEQAIVDLAALRMEVEGMPGRRLIAAGVPWFMTVFGRDTIIASLQTLALGGELARDALLTLADLQSDADDPVNDAEPGKILHEIRRGASARAWTDCYYGTVDATPLFLVLLGEYWRWTDDRATVRALKPAALRALSWIDDWGDLDGDGFVEYERRGTGILNQTWKDSDESITFADGTRPTGRIAAAEVQGYVYDAKRRLAEVAREVWRDRELADRLGAEADALFDRFQEAFWCERDGGWIYALALDGEKRPVNSLASNIGHLLWSGIVPEERVDSVVDLLMGPELWSGWGVRTLASGDAAYNPLTYHNGTVWPHDNSLIALGLARYGRHDEARRIARRMVDVAAQLEHQLPEVFAGFSRDDSGVPIVYPTATKPQAWASGTTIALLVLLLGLEPDRREDALTSTAPLPLPSWAGTSRLSGVHAFGRTWNVSVADGEVAIEEA